MLVAGPGKDVRTPDAQQHLDLGTFGVQPAHWWCARNVQEIKLRAGWFAQCNVMQ